MNAKKKTDEFPISRDASERIGSRMWSWEGPSTTKDLIVGDANGAAESIFRFTLQHADVEAPPFVTPDSPIEGLSQLRLWCYRVQRVWNRLARDTDLTEAERLVYQGQIAITEFGIAYSEDGRLEKMCNGRIGYVRSQCARNVYGPADLGDDLGLVLQERTWPEGQRRPDPQPKEDTPIPERQPSKAATDGKQNDHSRSAETAASDGTEAKPLHTKSRRSRKKTPPQLLRESRERQAAKELAKDPGITAERLGKLLGCHKSTVVRLDAWKKKRVLHRDPPRTEIRDTDSEEDAPPFDEDHE